MHDDVSRYASTVKIDPRVSCKNQINSHSLIKHFVDMHMNVHVYGQVKLEDNRQFSIFMSTQ